MWLRVSNEWKRSEREELKERYYEKEIFPAAAMNCHHLTCHANLYFTTKYIVYNGEDRLRLSLPLLLSSASAAASVTILVSGQDCGDGPLT